MVRLDEIRGRKIVNKIKEMRKFCEGKLKRMTFQKSNLGICSRDQEGKKILKMERR
jgi:hypothetical protein